MGHWIIILIEIFICSAVLGAAIALWPIFWFSVFAALNKTEDKLPTKASFLSPSSLKAMVTADNVFTFIQKIANTEKRIEYIKVIDNLKTMGLDIERHYSKYPENKHKFMLHQLKNMLAKSSVRDSVETVEFMKHAITFITEELNRIEFHGLARRSDEYRRLKIPRR